MHGSRKPIIGLSGGIGSGKSAVAAEFARCGALVIDSDDLNRRVLERAEVKAELARWWGADIVRADGRVDRRRIAEIIFGDEQARRRLEGLVHPLIDALRADIMIKGLAEDPASAIILDSPLLFESSLSRHCDFTVFVESSEQQRLERVGRSRGWDARELSRREQAQWPLSEKRRQSSHLIRNDSTLDELRSRARQLLVQLLELARAPKEFEDPPDRTPESQV